MSVESEVEQLRAKRLTFTQPHVVVVGGPAGCGKTTVGKMLAELLQTEFIEGDELHSEHNINKMSNGIPLTDEDRKPWLEKISIQSTQAAKANNNLSVVSCSMLKKIYRELISQTSPETKFVFVFIYTTYEELVKRVTNRPNHYMKNDMVKSQYDIMEVPEKDEGVAVNVFELNQDQVFTSVVDSILLFVN